LNKFATLSVASQSVKPASVASVASVAQFDYKS